MRHLLFLVLEKSDVIDDNIRQTRVDSLSVFYIGYSTIGMPEENIRRLSLAPLLEHEREEILSVRRWCRRVNRLVYNVTSGKKVRSERKMIFQGFDLINHRIPFLAFKRTRAFASWLFSSVSASREQWLSVLFASILNVKWIGCRSCSGQRAIDGQEVRDAKRFSSKQSSWFFRLGPMVLFNQYMIVLTANPYLNAY